MEKVLITGGTGLIGIQLRNVLLERGYEVAVLSRTKRNESGVLTYLWNPDKNEIDKEAINSADYIIHLAGVNIGEKRWTANRKQLILESRIKSGELILNNLDQDNNRLKAYITASGIGYYGAITTENIFTETDEPAADFLGQVCEKWEHITEGFDKKGVRTVKIRTGVVLSASGGALAKMLVPIKLGIGSALGSGKQYFPWIHIDDLCRIYLKAIGDDTMKGAYNAVSPESLTNEQFTRSIARYLNKPFWFPPVPSFILQIMFGEMSKILLTGSRVSADKIQAEGFIFKFPKLRDALKHLIG
jgi:uncharacterized protein (TIGR01777 family)